MERLASGTRWAVAISRRCVVAASGKRFAVMTGMRLHPETAALENTGTLRPVCRIASQTDCSVPETRPQGLGTPSRHSDRRCQPAAGAQIREAAAAKRTKGSGRSAMAEAERAIGRRATGWA